MSTNIENFVFNEKIQVYSFNWLAKLVDYIILTKSIDLIVIFIGKRNVAIKYIICLFIL